jgi:hypothetical protein
MSSRWLPRSVMANLGSLRLGNLLTASISKDHKGDTLQRLALLFFLRPSEIDSQERVE